MFYLRFSSTFSTPWDNQRKRPADVTQFMRNRTPRDLSRDRHHAAPNRDQAQSQG